MAQQSVFLDTRKTEVYKMQVVIIKSKKISHVR